MCKKLRCPNSVGEECIENEDCQPYAYCVQNICQGSTSDFEADDGMRLFSQDDRDKIDKIKGHCPGLFSKEVNPLEGLIMG